MRSSFIAACTKEVAFSLFHTSHRAIFYTYARNCLYKPSRATLKTALIECDCYSENISFVSVMIYVYRRSHNCEGNVSNEAIISVFCFRIPRDL